MQKILFFLFIVLLLAMEASSDRRHRLCRAGWIKEKLFGHKLMILGDSNFVFVWREFLLNFQTISRYKNSFQSSGCETYKHFDMVIDSDYTWRNPQELGIKAGPYTHGLKTPYCTDCSSCFSKRGMFNHNDRDVQGEFRLEFFPLLFAKDVVIQSKKYNTTQEHLVEYLKSSGYNSNDYILFNVGLHEMSHSTLQQYGLNMRYLSDLLATVGSKLIFVNTPQSNSKKLPSGFDVMYTIDLTDKFNDAADEVISKNKNVIGSVDTSPFSLIGTEFPHYFKDGHHFQLNSSFYNSIMMQTLYIICSYSS